MLRRRSACLLGISFLVAAQTVCVGAAYAGVPRACIHPDYDPIECSREQALVRNAVLGTRRLQELQRQLVELESQVPLQDAERNRLLRDIRGLLLYPARR